MRIDDDVLRCSCIHLANAFKFKGFHLFVRLMLEAFCGSEVDIETLMN